MKKVYFTGAFLSSVLAYSQIGIHTEIPKATLDVVALPKDLAKVDGIIAPRLDKSELKAKDNLYTAEQRGAIVYITAVNVTSSSKTANITVPGYYYFDGEIWQALNTKEPWNIQGTTNQAMMNTDNIYQMGSVAVGRNIALAGAQLDVAGAIRGGGANRTAVVGENSLAIGQNTIASAPNSISLGNSTKAEANNAIALGWNTVASGLRSSALGEGTTASGDNSTALGRNTAASGLQSSAFGQGTTASGENSTSFGLKTTASGANAFTLGWNTSASGNGAFAAGQDNDAIGNNSVAIGLNATAKGNRSISVGSRTLALEDDSFAMGTGSEARGVRSMAFGYDAIATGMNSTSIGWSTKSNGDRSLATGYFTVAGGDNSASFGYESKATADRAFATGNNTIASGTNSFSGGSGTKASGENSIAFGHDTSAAGDRSFATGRNTIAAFNNETVIGQWNYGVANGGNADAPDGTVFQIGTGAENNRSNAITVRKNGWVGIGYFQPSTASDEVLRINGKVRMSGELYVPAGVTPDYVFEKHFDGISPLKPDYKMMSLEQIEEFTRNNKHLPGVPSAKEIKEQGSFSLIKATEINLEKIEELYLHIIELKKEIVELKKQVKAQP